MEVHIAPVLKQLFSDKDVTRAPLDSTYDMQTNACFPCGSLWPALSWYLKSSPRSGIFTTVEHQSVPSKLVLQSEIVQTFYSRSAVNYNVDSLTLACQFIYGCRQVHHLNRSMLKNILQAPTRSSALAGAVAQTSFTRFRNMVLAVIAFCRQNCQT